MKIKQSRASTVVTSKGGVRAQTGAQQSRSNRQEALARLQAVFERLKTPSAFRALILRNTAQTGKPDEVYILSVLKVVHTKEELSKIHRDFAEGYDSVPADAEAVALLRSMRGSKGLPSQSESKDFPKELVLVGAAAFLFLLFKK